MFKLPFEWLLGLRYIRAKRRNGFISFISMSSMIGIGLGVMALITVMSIMNGFQQELRERILGMTAHMTLSESHQRLSQWQGLYEVVKHHPDVIGAAPNIMEQGMLTFGERVKGVMIRGVLPEYEQQVSDLAANMVIGDMSGLRSSQFGIVLGFDLGRVYGFHWGIKSRWLLRKVQFRQLVCYRALNV